MTSPFVSILVPTFNSARYLGVALDSVTAAREKQGGHLAVETLVQDGGSSDGTLEIARAHPAMACVVSRPDDGQADALDLALMRARGEWVAWLNSDDVLLPNAFTALQTLSRISPTADVIHGGYLLLNAEGRILRRYEGKRWSKRRLYLTGNYIFSGATFFRRAYLTQLRFNKALQYVMDLDLFLRVNPLRTIHTTEPLAGFRFWSDSKSGSRGSSFIREASLVREMHRADPGIYWFDKPAAQALMSLSQTTLALRRTKTWATARQATSDVAAAGLRVCAVMRR